MRMSTFYSASTYTTLGIDIDLFTPIFAISRISGWAAHVLEQHDDNRLIRPRADYTGPAYPAHYTPTRIPLSIDPTLPSRNPTSRF